MRFTVSVLPVGSGGSLLEPIAEVVAAIHGAGLDYRVSGIEAVIDGAWEDVMPVVRRAEESLLRRREDVYVSISVIRDRSPRRAPAPARADRAARPLEPARGTPLGGAVDRAARDPGRGAPVGDPRTGARAIAD